MAKIATRYLEIDPWRIIEKGFHPERNQVSESIFSLANEFMGVRGFLEEGFSGKSLQGIYYNGIYEWGEEERASYKGIIGRTHYLVNGLNWLKTSILIDGKTLDIGQEKIRDFERVLDLRSGTLTRSLTLINDFGEISFTFIRFLSMRHCNRGYQRVIIASDYPAEMEISFGLDFDTKHWGRPGRWQAEFGAGGISVLGRTESTGQFLAAAAEIQSSLPYEIYKTEKEIGARYRFKLQGEAVFDRKVSIFADRQGEKREELLLAAEADLQKSPGFSVALEDARAYWEDFWQRTDVEIEGDPENQQGIRFCIYHLQQTYHGFDPGNNIGAKGLTGEAYSGHAFWDTETYCLPFYLFNNLSAARDLLIFRYRTLPEARKRARELDCEGACYPIATLNGHEACSLWQHASLQLQPSTGVAYGIYHYYRVSADREFLADYGFEMLVEISRFLLSRGQWNREGKFGYYCVMGPDEFQMMVHHNSYTNYLAKRTFLFTLEVRDLLKDNDKYEQIIEKLGIGEDFFRKIKTAAAQMLLLYDPETELFEQHLGYFELPHIDIGSIPVTDFPLYNNWSYDRIYRNDMIKQPDVLMFLFLFASDFPLSVKKANYEFYEPRCIHESSLSPSVHSILAAEIGKKDEALAFFEFATRLDLDDYNRNAEEGLHLTSIAAAWMNIVYGFGGLRSDGACLSLAPQIPAIWKRYAFKINYRGKNIRVEVTKDEVKLSSDDEKPATLLLYGKEIILRDEYRAELRK